MIGVVKYFNLKTRYGFILGGKGEPDIFFHENVLEGSTVPREGHEVEYELNPSFPVEKPRALAVKLLTKRSYVPISEGRKRGSYGD